MDAEPGMHTTRARKASRWRTLGVLLAVISLFVQSFIVQPHIDGLAFVQPARVHQSLQASAPEKAPRVCIICQEAALGAITLAATPALLLVERTFIDAAPAQLQRVVCRTPSHNWQSRAPPHFA